MRSRISAVLLTIALRDVKPAFITGPQRKRRNRRRYIIMNIRSFNIFIRSCVLQFGFSVDVEFSGTAAVFKRRKIRAVLRTDNPSEAARLL
ncbi:MAG: hypothetical protein JJ902_22260 [Roseibium sp.]|nr:hypothetical protein [Roseibium sp.]